jgi:hypothetical protein
MLMIGYLRAFYFYQEIHKKHPELYPSLKNDLVHFCNGLNYDVKFTPKELSYIHVDETDMESEEWEEEANDHLIELFENSSVTDFSTSSDDSFTSLESGMDAVTDDLHPDRASTRIHAMHNENVIIEDKRQKSKTDSQFQGKTSQTDGSGQIKERGQITERGTAPITERGEREQKTLKKPSWMSNHRK